MRERPDDGIRGTDTESVTNVSQTCKSWAATYRSCQQCIQMRKTVPNSGCAAWEPTSSLWRKF